MQDGEQSYLAADASMTGDAFENAGSRDPHSLEGAAIDAALHHVVSRRTRWKVMLVAETDSDQTSSQTVNSQKDEGRFGGAEDG
jgi:hypothetical protein